MNPSERAYDKCLHLKVEPPIRNIKKLNYMDKHGWSFSCIGTENMTFPQ